MPTNALAPSAAMARAKRNQGLNALPDTDRYKVRFEVRSQSSDQIYRVSFDAAPGAGYWVCSCRGAISHGSCKHLESAGLRGRKYGKDLDTLKALGL